MSISYSPSWVNSEKMWTWRQVGTQMFYYYSNKSTLPFCITPSHTATTNTTTLDHFHIAVLNNEVSLRTDVKHPTWMTMNGKQSLSKYLIKLFNLSFTWFDVNNTHLPGQSSEQIGKTAWWENVTRLESFCLKTPLSALKRAKKRGSKGQRAQMGWEGERDESHSVWSTVRWVSAAIETSPTPQRLIKQAT